MKVFNFSAGPAVLPREVLERAAAEMLDWHGSGMSVMEMSHRGKEFIAIAEKAEADLRALMNIPANYKVLFLQGGASAQFAMVPMNLLRGKKSADYINTGEWSKKAIKEAKKFCAVNVAASAEPTNFTTAPSQKDWKLDPDAAYVHYTPNETIHGVEFHDVPEVDAPLVADFSSSLLSRPIDVSRFGVIYGGAQKNLGPSGITIAIVRKDLLGRHGRQLPPIFELGNQASNDSMFNTPPTFSWYVVGLVLEWIKEQGGAAAMGERNDRKAALLYSAIEGSGGFYRNEVAVDCRSRMNVPFFLPDPALDKPFLKGAEAAGLLGLKGHRALGGMRASLYNAVSLEAVQALVDFMGEFRRTNG